jgi:hypothetical protein
MSPIDQILLKISVSLSSKHAGMGFLWNSSAPKVGMGRALTRTARSVLSMTFKNLVKPNPDFFI